jgi:hypothetical protein
MAQHHASINESPDQAPKHNDGYTSGNRNTLRFPKVNLEDTLSKMSEGISGRQILERLVEGGILLRTPFLTYKNYELLEELLSLNEEHRCQLARISKLGSTLNRILSKISLSGKSHYTKEFLMHHSSILTLVDHLIENKLAWIVNYTTNYLAYSSSMVSPSVSIIYVLVASPLGKHAIRDENCAITPPRSQI